MSHARLQKIQVQGYFRTAVGCLLACREMLRSQQETCPCCDRHACLSFHLPTVRPIAACGRLKSSPNDPGSEQLKGMALSETPSCRECGDTTQHECLAACQARHGLHARRGSPAEAGLQAAHHPARVVRGGRSPGHSKFQRTSQPLEKGELFPPAQATTTLLS